MHGLFQIVSLTTVRLSRLHHTTSRTLASESAIQSCREYKLQIDRITENKHESERQHVKLVSEMRCLLQKAEEREAESNKALKRERDISQTLRLELKETEEKVQSLLLSRISLGPEDSSFSILSERDAKTEVRLLSPASSNEVNALRRQLKEMGDALRAVRAESRRDTSSIMADEAPLLINRLKESVAECEALRSRIVLLETDLHNQKPKQDLNFIAKNEELKTQLEQMHHDLNLSKRESSLQKSRASNAEAECARLKETVEKLKNELQKFSGVKSSSDLGVKAKGFQDVSTLPTENFSSGVFQSKSVVEKQLEKIITQMSEVKAENVALKAQIAFQQSQDKTGLLLQDKKFSPIRGNQRVSFQEELASPWKAADSKLADEIRDLSRKNAYLEAVLKEQRTSPRNWERSPRTMMSTPEVPGPHEPSKKEQKLSTKTLTLNISKSATPTRFSINESTPIKSAELILSSARSSPIKSTYQRLAPAGRSPDASISTSSVRRRREVPGGNHFDTLSEIK